MPAYAADAASGKISIDAFIRARRVSIIRLMLMRVYMRAAMARLR